MCVGVNGRVRIAGAVEIQALTLGLEKIILTRLLVYGCLMPGTVLEEYGTALHAIPSAWRGEYLRPR